MRSLLIFLASFLFAQAGFFELQNAMGYIVVEKNGKKYYYLVVKKKNGVSLIKIDRKTVEDIKRGL